MPLTLPQHQISLQLPQAAAKTVTNLSAVRCIGPHLWLGADEGTAVERLTLTDHCALDHHSFNLLAYLDLPGGAAEEIDIEGLAYADYYLWVTGSHSLRRKKPSSSGTAAETVDRLAAVSCQENRYLIGRIPLVDGQLYRQCPHPEDAAIQLSAAQLKRYKTGNQLTHVLAKDPHLGAFVTAAIPGKDNGFDVEGIAVSGDRVFLGLRGPVLRGWAVLLELQLKQQAPEQLKLKKIDGDRRYRKHFLNLKGLGIRDLCWNGNDLLVLAGPTMDLAGLAQVFCIADAAATLASGHCLSPSSLLDFPDQAGDKAEGISLINQASQQLLVVYDSPSPARCGQGSVKADVFALPGGAAQSP